MRRIHGEQDSNEERVRRRRKARLRRERRSARRQVPPDVREQHSARIAERVTSHPSFGRSRTVLGYMPLGDEVDIEPVLDAARQAGKCCALTRLDPTLDALVVHQWAPGDALARAPFDVLEPLPSAPSIAPGRVDLVLVPALALDERGNRVGYGKGYYDGLLAKMPAATRFAVAY